MKITAPVEVGIIGCGWLGKALATALLEKKVTVLATSSQMANVKQLTLQHLQAQQLSLPASPEQLAKHDVFTAHAIVIAIPPQFKRGRTDYSDKIKTLVDAAQQRGCVQRIILISSTGIYEGLSGTVDETSTLHMASEKVQILQQAEQAVLAFQPQASVLRLAGLVGPNRHPGKFLAANKALKDSTAKINLIHQDDAVGLLIKLLAEDAPQGVFNGVSANHVSKKTYYQHAAKALGLPVPAIAGEQSLAPARVVCGAKVKRALNYSFIYPDLLAWL